MDTVRTIDIGQGHSFAPAGGVGGAREQAETAGQHDRILDEAPIRKRRIGRKAVNFEAEGVQTRNIGVVLSSSPIRIEDRRSARWHRK